MLIYIGLTRPVDRDTEEEIEAHLLKWFHRNKEGFHLEGIFPYDPVMMEYSVDIGSGSAEKVALSLEQWILRLGMDETDLLISDRSVLDGMTDEERCEHLKRKVRFLLDSVRQMNRGSTNPRIRQLEFLLSGVSSEADKLLAGPPSMTVSQAPVQDEFSRELDEFWESL